MKVFISWSGERSKAAAVALTELLPAILQPIQCWMSEENLEKGKPWFDQLRSELNQILFGVFCVTPENWESPWMQWEAGLLSSSSALGDRRVAPIAIGTSKGSIRGPLAIYQGTDADREDVLRLIKHINLALDEKQRVPATTLETTFAYVWPQLEQRLKAAVALVTEKKPVIPTDVRLDEITALLRDVQRTTAEFRQDAEDLKAYSLRPDPYRLLQTIEHLDPELLQDKPPQNEVRAALRTIRAVMNAPPSHKRRSSLVSPTRAEPDGPKEDK